MPTPLNKITTLAKQGTALAAPEDNEAQAFREKQQNLDEYKKALTPSPLGSAMPAPAPTAEADKSNPSAQYGDKPGEQRIDVTNMLKPLGRYAGGTDAVPETGPYILEEGEKVIPAEQNPDNPDNKVPDVVIGAKQYPNPNNIKPVPMSDTDAMYEPDTKMLHKEQPAAHTEGLPKIQGTRMDTSNPAPAQIIPAEKPQASMSPLGSVTGHQASNVSKEAPAPDPTGVVQKQRDLVQKDKEEAASKGDLVGLGTALLHEKELNKTAPIQAVMDKAAQDAVTAPAPLGGASQPQPVLNKIPGAPETHPTTAVDAVKGKIQAYDQGIQQALDAGDQVKADQLKVAKYNFEQMNPYGSEGNHPGILGRIEHGLAKAGNVAGDIVAPGVMAITPGTALNRKVQNAENVQGIEQGEQERLQESEKQEHEALAKNAGVGKTPAERTYQDLLHGGPQGGPKVNPDTNAPYTPQEAQIASQGTAKTPEELDTQDLMKQVNPETGKNYTRLEAHQKALEMKAGTKPLNEKAKAIQDYLVREGKEDTPENRDDARVKIESRDAEAKALAALPPAEAKARFQANLTEEEQALNSTRADSLARGKSADEMQAKEDARSQKVMGTIKTAQDALNSSDHSEFAASIAPVVATMATSNAEGIKRLNPTELAKFSPASGSLYRWAQANGDKFLAGDIPDEYRKEVGDFLARVQAAEHVEHLINTHAVDTTIRNGAIQPVVNEKTGKVSGTTKSTPQEPAETNPPAKAPGATSGFKAWKQQQQQ